MPYSPPAADSLPSGAGTLLIHTPVDVRECGEQTGRDLEEYDVSLRDEDMVTTPTGSAAPGADADPTDADADQTDADADQTDADADTTDADADGTDADADQSDSD